MSRRHTVLFGFIILILASLACNAFAPSGGEPGAALPPPSIADLTMTPETQVVDGLAPTATLPNQEVATIDPDGQATARVLVDLNIRKGPGVQYDRVGFLLSNETAPILGQDPASGWWKIICPPRVNEVTECWISGGAQYSSAVNAGSVPIAAVPPTPTPEPTITATPENDDTSTTANTVSTSSAYMVYTSSDGLYIASLTDALTNSLAADNQIVADPLISQVTISPNGQYIAYLSDIGNDQLIKIYSVNTQNMTTLVELSDLDLDFNDAFENSVNQLEWVNNSTDLVFNTVAFNTAGPGIFETGDLYQVDIDGDLTQLAGEGEFGGLFSINGNQIMGGTNNAILLTSTSGETAVTLYEFPVVNTASEYFFFPRAQWIDNSTAYISIPAEEPFAAGTFEILQVATNGFTSTPVTLPGFGLFDAVRWSSNGSNMAFVDQVSETNISILNLGNGDGSNFSETDRSATITPYDWSPNGSSLLYFADGYYAVGSRTGAPVQYLTSEGVISMEWVSDSLFITAVGSRGQWQLVANSTAGNSNTLAIANVDFVELDIWSP